MLAHDDDEEIAKIKRPEQKRTEQNSSESWISLTRECFWRKIATKAAAATD